MGIWHVQVKAISGKQAGLFTLAFFVPAGRPLARPPPPQISGILTPHIPLLLDGAAERRAQLTTAANLGAALTQGAAIPATACRR